MKKGLQVTRAPHPKGQHLSDRAQEASGQMWGGTFLGTLTAVGLCPPGAGAKRGRETGCWAVGGGTGSPWLLHQYVRD